MSGCFASTTRPSTGSPTGRGDRTGHRAHRAAPHVRGFRLGFCAGSAATDSPPRSWTPHGGGLSLRPRRRDRIPPSPAPVEAQHRSDRAGAALEVIDRAGAHGHPSSCSVCPPRRPERPHERSSGPRVRSAQPPSRPAPTMTSAAVVVTSTSSTTSSRSAAARFAPSTARRAEPGDCCVAPRIVLRADPAPLVPNESRRHVVPAAARGPATRRISASARRASRACPRRP